MRSISDLQQTMYTIQLLYKILNNNIGILFPSKMYKFMKNKQLI